MLSKLPSKCRVEFCQQQINITDKSGLLGKFLDCWESFQMIWKVLGWSGKFLDSFESYQTIGKIFGLLGKLPDDLESFPWSEKFLDNLDCWESFQMIW